jgi:hypothetical protein
MMGSINGSIKLLSSENYHVGTRACKNRVRQRFDSVSRLSSYFFLMRALEVFRGVFDSLNRSVSEGFSQLWGG